MYGQYQINYNLLVQYQLFLKRQNLYSSKLKEFADNNFKFDKNEKNSQNG